jgi:ecotin
MIKAWTSALLFLMLIPASQAGDYMKAFPPPDPGMARHVLQLPPQADEAAFRVELIIGKTLWLDPHNRYFLGGALGAETIQGWGFTRYVLPALGPLAGTLMAADPHAPKVARFITLGGEPYVIRYNSKLPVVVYVPDGVEVRYRIWAASAETKPIPKQ